MRQPDPIGLISNIIIILILLIITQIYTIFLYFKEHLQVRRRKKMAPVPICLIRQMALQNYLLVEAELQEVQI